MGSHVPSTVPIIDFSELSVGCPKWDLVKAQVKQALEEYGCFEVLFPKISLDIRKAFIRSLEELFDLPLETKQKLSKGYVGQNPELPLYESMRIGNALVPKNMETFINLLWPQGNADIRVTYIPIFFMIKKHRIPKSTLIGVYTTETKRSLVNKSLFNLWESLYGTYGLVILFHSSFLTSLSETMQSYSNQLSKLDQMVRRMVLESLGLEDYMTEHMDSTNYVLRMMKYKRDSTNKTNHGLASHTDFGIVTILHQNQVDGLEVQTKDGGEWINVTPSQDSFIVLIGLILHAWTNGRFHAPHHRVMLRRNEPRYSAGLFSVPKGGYIIKAPENTIDEQHPLLYKPFDHDKFLEFYNNSKKGISALKTYCGV